MSNSLLANRFDVNAQWDLRDWLMKPWFPQLNPEEEGMADVVSMLTILPIIAGALTFFLNIIPMINAGTFDGSSFLWGVGGLIVSAGLVILQIFVSHSSKHQPLTYETQTHIESLLMILISQNSDYTHIADNVKDRFDRADDRWGRDLIIRLQRVVDQRKKFVEAEQKSLQFKQYFA